MINQYQINEPVLHEVLPPLQLRGIVGNVFYQHVSDSRNQAGQRSLRGLQDLDTEPNSPPQNPPQHQSDKQTKNQIRKV